MNITEPLIEEFRERYGAFKILPGTAWGDIPADNTYGVSGVIIRFCDDKITFYYRGMLQARDVYQCSVSLADPECPNKVHQLAQRLRFRDRFRRYVMVPVTIGGLSALLMGLVAFLFLSMVSSIL